jgi:methyl-accepting chemotaxis protein
MPWYALLIVALASLAVVVGALVSAGLKGWRLAKHGASVSKRIASLANGLSRRADELAAAAERLSADGEQLAANMGRLQASVARLQVVADTVSEAMEPFLLLTGWLSGERGYNDWHRWSRTHPR